MSRALPKNVELSDEARGLLERDIETSFLEYTTVAAGTLDSIRELRDLYEGILEPKEDEWSSNLHMPFTEWIVDQAAEKMEMVALGTEPLFDVEGVDEAAVDLEGHATSALQRWLEMMRYRPKAAMAIRYSFVDGTAYLIAGVQGTGKAAPEPAFMMPEDTPILAHDLDVAFPIEFAQFEDVAIMPFDAPSLDRAKAALSRRYTRWNDLKAGARAGTYYADAVDRLETYWTTPPSTDTTRVQRDIPATQPQTIWHATFEVWEGLYRFAGPDDEEEQEYLITAAYSKDQPGSVIVLRCVPYRSVYKRRYNIVPVITNPRPNSMIGKPLSQSVKDLQLFSNATANQISDSVTINIAPPIVMSAQNAQTRENIEWGPMEIWALPNPADVKILSGGAASLQAAQVAAGQVEGSRQMMERLSGSTDVTGGRPSPERRTAYEIGIVVQSGSDKINVRVARVQFGMDESEGLEAFAATIMDLLDLFLPKNRPIQYKARPDGVRSFPSVPAETYSQAYEFIPHGNTVTSNPEVRYKRALAAIEYTKQNPFLMISPLDTKDSIVKKVKMIWRDWNDLYQALGYTNVNRMMGDEPQNLEDSLIVAAAINPLATQQIVARLAGAQAEPGGPGPGAGPGGPPAGMGPGQLPPTPEAGSEAFTPATARAGLVQGAGLPGPGASAGMAGANGGATGPGG